MRFFPKFRALVSGLALLAGSLFAGSVQQDRFGGIGVQLEEKNKQVVISRVLKDSPAESQGLLVGDILIRVEGESIESMNMSQILQKMRGEAGTAIELEVQRASRYVSFELVRVPIRLNQASVEQLGMSQQEILYRSEILRELEAESKAMIFVNNQEMNRDYIDKPENEAFRIFSIELGGERKQLEKGPFKLESNRLGISLPEEGIYELEIYNAKGELLKIFEMNAESANPMISFDLLKGARFLVVRQGDFFASLKHSF